MQEFKTEIISHLLLQPGILACLLRKHTSLETRITAWFTGEKPILLIGGEPGNGKSLLMGDLVLQHHTLVQRYPAIRTPLALISYDRVHYLFLKRLTELTSSDRHDFLPEGETYPDARKLISQILQDVLLFAAQHLAPNTLIILEAPLIGHRGDELVDTLSACGLHTQIFIMHSPAMWAEMLYQRQLPERETSAQTLAMQQIHKALLLQRAIPQTEHTEDITLRKSWEQWLKSYDGLVLAWNPIEDKPNFLYTREMLKTMKIAPDPLSPEILQKYTSCLIDLVLEFHPDLHTLALAIQNYNR